MCNGINLIFIKLRLDSLIFAVLNFTPMTDCIPYKDAKYFSELMVDYLDRNEKLTDFYHNYPDIKGFEKQIEEREKAVSKTNRSALTVSLIGQYACYHGKISKNVKDNITSLVEPNTFTITTGHQLNLFTGPLYFLYKIVSVINLTKKLKIEFPDKNFVPVYWMATEDHDFEEINYFNFKGKKIHWNRASGGAVGKFSTEGLQEVYDLFSQDLGVGANADKLRELFRKAYLDHSNLTEATRFLVNELFAEEGLVIVDGNDKALKKLLIPHIKQDIFENVAYEQVSESASDLELLGYGVQVNPREINLFYLSENSRDRIVAVEGGFEVLDTNIRFTEKQLLDAIENTPEKFSPNVIMRPLYQEVILPNLCYIGGGGEIAYWLELKNYFDAAQVTFPILLLRNSALLVTEKQAKKLANLQIPFKQLFLKRDSFINKKVREISDIDIDFSKQKKQLHEQFKTMYTIAEETDKSFIGAVKAQEVKQLKGLEHLEKRLLKAQKRKLADHVVRITEIQNELFPNQSLQERTANFSEAYLEYGEQLIPWLLETLDPLNGCFTILVK